MFSDGLMRPIASTRQPDLRLVDYLERDTKGLMPAKYEFGVNEGTDVLWVLSHLTKLWFVLIMRTAERGSAAGSRKGDMFCYQLQGSVFIFKAAARSAICLRLLSQRSMIMSGSSPFDQSMIRELEDPDLSIPASAEKLKAQWDRLQTWIRSLPYVQNVVVSNKTSGGLNAFLAIGRRKKEWWIFGVVSSRDEIDWNTAKVVQTLTLSDMQECVICVPLLVGTLHKVIQDQRTAILESASTLDTLLDDLGIPEPMAKKEGE